MASSLSKLALVPDDRALSDEFTTFAFTPVPRSLKLFALVVNTVPTFLGNPSGVILSITPAVAFIDPITKYVTLAFAGLLS